MSAANTPDNRQNQPMRVERSEQPDKQNGSSTAPTDWFRLDARLRSAIVRAVLTLADDD